MRLEKHINSTRDHQKAKDLRKNQSPAERKLWNVLRKQTTAGGLSFRRQQPIHPYVADFVCLKARLVIELDGFSHESRLTYDKKRDAYLKSLGYRVLRFSNDEIIRNVYGVVETILHEADRALKTIPVSSCNTPPSLTLPSRGRGQKCF
jgi:very-short-patch-repair endonuclease